MRLFISDGPPTAEIDAPTEPPDVAAAISILQFAAMLDADEECPVDLAERTVERCELKIP